MKIYINTLTQTDLAAIQDKELLDGKKEDELTQATAVINDEPFIPGEWKHVPDTFVVDQKAYPYIKEAHVVLQERTAEALKEKGLDAFAQGLKEAATLYKTSVPSVVEDVHKYAPFETQSFEEPK